MDSSADYGGGGTTISTKDVSTAGFPQFPGDATILAHAASQYKDVANDRLAARGLLGVAQGLLPDAAACIVDVSLAGHPALPPDHKDYERRSQFRISAIAKNESNEKRRLQLTLHAWTEIYTLFAASTEHSAPVLHRELKELCDMAKTT